MDEDVGVNADFVQTKRIAVASMEPVQKDVFQVIEEKCAKKVRLWLSYYIFFMSLLFRLLYSCIYLTIDLTFKLILSIKVQNFVVVFV